MRKKIQRKHISSFTFPEISYWFVSSCILLIVILAVVFLVPPSNAFVVLLFFVLLMAFVFSVLRTFKRTVAMSLILSLSVCVFLILKMVDMNSFLNSGLLLAITVSFLLFYK